MSLRSFVAHAAVLLAAVFLPVAGVTAGEPIVFHPAYAPGLADNPLKGFVPYAGQGRKFPHSLEFDYLSLASMMTGPTNFNWAPMERLLDGIAARGCQSVFRIYMEFPRRPSGVPEYLVQAGVKMRAWTNTNTQPLPPALGHTPDYEDPRLRAALTNFIAALGARYDGDPRLGEQTAIVAAKRPGTCTITATIGQVRQTCMVTVTPATLPAGWSFDELSAPPIPGSVSVADGRFTLIGCGHAVTGFGERRRDPGAYVSQAVTGEAAISARLPRLAPNVGGPA